MLWRILNQLKSTHAEKRLHAVQGLHSHQDPKAVIASLKATYDADWRVADAAENELKKFDVENSLLRRFCLTLTTGSSSPVGNPAH